MPHPADIDRRTVFISIIMVAVIVAVTGMMSLYVVSDPGLRQVYSLIAAAQLIDELYPGEYDRPSLIREARRGMFDRLDRYSGYMPQSRFERMDEELTGGYFGLGITVVPHEKGLMILSVREGSPAAKSGLMASDVILMADSVLLAELDAERATSLLRGAEGTTVLLTIERPGKAESTDVGVIRGRIPLLHIPYAGTTDDSVVYIRLLDFESGASDDLQAALDSLVVERASEVRAIILDLRGNPGGLFGEACEVADLFLPEGTMICGTDGRSRWYDNKYYATEPDMTAGLPIAILVDRSSASASEIVAGALKLAGRAMLVGDTTFGKGLVQGFTRFPDGDGLRLTISRYFFDGGRYLNVMDSTLDDNGTGLEPDLVCDFPEDDPFVRAIENSLLLQRFAGEFHKNILDAANNNENIEELMSSLAIYADQDDFSYESPVTKSAGLILEIAQIQKPDSKLLEQTAKETYREARESDKRLFDEFRDYLLMRLEQIAFAREYGSYTAYHEIIVPNRADIKLARAQLRERQL